MTTAPAGDDVVPYGTRLGQLADELGDATAVTFVDVDGGEQTISWRQLDTRSTQLAHVLAQRGLGVGDRLAVGLPNSLEHLYAGYAGWKVGATVVPVRWDLPEWERSRLLEVLDPALAIGTDQLGLVRDSVSAPVTPLPEVIAPRGSGVCSSGSTGSPKVILRDRAGRVPALHQRHLHGGGGLRTHGAAPAGAVPGSAVPHQRVHGLPHPAGWGSHRPVGAVQGPRWCWTSSSVTGSPDSSPPRPCCSDWPRCPGSSDRDLSSLTWVQQGASPLPVWLGHRWIELVGPEHFYMSYGASESFGIVVCRGDQWLAHPGTLGRGMTGTEIAVRSESGEALPPGEIGGIYLRTPTGPLATYVGSDVKPMDTTADGFTSVGDLGWLDEDGFLYMADRRVDMIVTGAVNVFPAEVEAALSEHPGIADVVVVGLRDAEWGRRVHAIVQLSDPALDADGVTAFARERLAPYKVPKSVEFVEAIPRSEAMKFNRAALVAERDGPNTEAGGPPAAAAAPPGSRGAEV